MWYSLKYEYCKYFLKTQKALLLLFLEFVEKLGIFKVLPFYQTTFPKHLNPQYSHFKYLLYSLDVT